MIGKEYLKIVWYSLYRLVIPLYVPAALLWQDLYIHAECTGPYVPFVNFCIENLLSTYLENCYS